MVCILVTSLSRKFYENNPNFASHRSRGPQLVTWVQSITQGMCGLVPLLGWGVVQSSAARGRHHSLFNLLDAWRSGTRGEVDTLDKRGDAERMLYAGQ